MTDLVDPREIELIVGENRHSTLHWGRVVNQTFYILHSKECLSQHEDLRDCPYSLALDDYDIVDQEWGDEADLIVLKDSRLRAWTYLAKIDAMCSFRFPGEENQIAGS